jgi:hypothetical protein
MNPVTATINHFAPAAVILLALLSYFRRKEEIGGWLMVFFSQIYVGVAVVLLGSIPIVAKAFPATPSGSSPVAKLVAVVTLLRLAAYAIVAIVSTFLLRERNSIWVQRLRLAIGAALLLNGITLVVDILYFPSTLVRNLFGWLVLLAWLIYFFVSVRVKMVFLSKTWGETPVTKMFSEG